MPTNDAHRIVGIKGLIMSQLIDDIACAVILACAVMLPFVMYFDLLTFSPFNSEVSMLKIKLTISDNGVSLNGLFYDAKQNIGSINRHYSSEENALMEVQKMRERDCEFSLVVLRKV